MDGSSQSSAYRVVLCVAALLVPVFGDCELTWDAREIDLTTNPGDNEAVGVFRFTNSGNTPSTIDSVHSGCDCTTAELSKRSYAPGEAGEIKTVFAIGDRVGIQEKLIYVTTNDAPAVPIILKLRVKIPELLSCSSRLLFWCTAENPEEKSVVVTSTGSRKIVAIEASPSVQAAAALRVENVVPETKYQLFIKPASIEKPKNMTFDFVAKFADNTIQRIRLYVVVRDLPEWQSR